MPPTGKGTSGLDIRQKPMPTEFSRLHGVFLHFCVILYIRYSFQIRLTGRQSNTYRSTMNRRHKLLIPCLFATLTLLFVAVLAVNHIFFIAQVRKNTIMKAEERLTYSARGISSFLIQAESMADYAAFKFKSAL